MEKFFVKNFADLIPEKNTSPYKRVLVIGDIHGNFKRLMSLWKKIHVTDDDFVFFLGDYIDRGEEIGETVRWVLQKSKEKNIEFLRGNHEQMFIDASKEDPAAEEWRKTWFINGGKKTLVSLQKLSKVEPTIIENFLRLAKKMATSCSIKIGGKIYFLCHAGVDPNFSLDEQIYENQGRLVRAVDWYTLAANFKNEFAKNKLKVLSKVVDCKRDVEKLKKHFLPPNFNGSYPSSLFFRRYGYMNLQKFMQESRDW